MAELDLKLIVGLRTSMVVIGLATVISLAIFILKVDVNWRSVLPLMLGSALGGRLGAALVLGPAAR
jgi:uncharacterized membrane protein YfcA